MEAWLRSLLQALALPEYGLTTLFIVAFLSATPLPLGSEPAVFGLVKLNPELFWPAMAVATVANTLGGMTSWWIGRAAHSATDRLRHSPTELRSLKWLERLGPKACVLSFLPMVGDPLCTAAGWLRLPALPCATWMAVGKFLRYLIMTAVLLWVWPESSPSGLGLGE